MLQDLTVEKSPPHVSPPAWRRWLRRGAMLVVSALLALALWVGIRSYRMEVALMYTPVRHAAPAVQPAEAVPEFASVHFRSRKGVALAGWYAPSRNGAAIVFCHGSGADRSQLLREAAALHARGFGALLFDWPGHGESEGEIHWGDGENSGLRGAIDFLLRQPGIEPERVGVLGFSMGGYVASLVAVLDPRPRALALVATPGNLERQTAWEFRRWGLLSQIPALNAMREYGPSPDAPTPEEVIGKISPRPVLIIGGSKDPIVPPSMVRRLFDAAEGPKQLLFVDSKDHGNFGDTSLVYVTALATFFERWLLAPAASSSVAAH
jgi:pimeloyl-ACP methyl ester carboxylesterase